MNGLSAAIGVVTFGYWVAYTFVDGLPMLPISMGIGWMAGSLLAVWLFGRDT